MEDKKIEAISSVYINVSSKAMLRTITTRSAENLPSEMAKDAEVGGNGDSGDDEMVKRSPLSKKPNGRMGYLTSLRSDANSIPFGKRQSLQVQQIELSSGPGT